MSQSKICLKLVSLFVHVHYNEFSVLQLPSQSLDLNPIELLWDVGEREIRSIKVYLKMNVMRDNLVFKMINNKVYCLHLRCKTMSHQMVSIYVTDTALLQPVSVRPTHSPKEMANV